MTDFDTNIGKVERIPQDMGQVLLNLFNNAFYAVQQRQEIAPDDYDATVTVSTHLLTCSPERASSITQSNGPGSQIEIRFQDNGTGIPDLVNVKIFQPIFIT